MLLLLLLLLINPVGLRSIVISVSVCSFVCLLLYFKNDTCKFHQIFCTCYHWSTLGPALTAVRYVLYFQFHVFFTVTNKNTPPLGTALQSTRTRKTSFDSAAVITMTLFLRRFITLYNVFRRYVGLSWQRQGYLLPFWAKLGDWKRNEPKVRTR